MRDNRKLGCHRGPCHKIAVLTEQPHVILSAGEDGYVFSHDVRKNKQERYLNSFFYDQNIVKIEVTMMFYVWLSNI